MKIGRKQFFPYLCWVILTNLAGLSQITEGIAISLVWETANFQEVEMILIAHLISNI
jgi:hypothetical protein